MKGRDLGVFFLAIILNEKLELLNAVKYLPKYFKCDLRNVVGILDKKWENSKGFLDVNNSIWSSNRRLICLNHETKFEWLFDFDFWWGKIQYKSCVNNKDLYCVENWLKRKLGWFWAKSRDNYAADLEHCWEWLWVFMKNSMTCFLGQYLKRKNHTGFHWPNEPGFQVKKDKKIMDLRWLCFCVSRSYKGS